MPLKRHFGSMQEARRRAGITKYIPPRGGNQIIPSNVIPV
jgi:hypothetical protein